jgi:hypothetical protein
VECFPQGRPGCTFPFFASLSAVAHALHPQVKLDPGGIARCFDKYASTSEKVINLDGFVSYLMSSDNAPIKDESEQDMTRPLPEYYISSSHNVRSTHPLPFVDHY